MFVAVGAPWSPSKYAWDFGLSSRPVGEEVDTAPAAVCWSGITPTGTGARGSLDKVLHLLLGSGLGLALGPARRLGLCAGCALLTAWELWQGSTGAGEIELADLLAGLIGFLPCWSLTAASGMAPVHQLRSVPVAPRLRLVPPAPSPSPAGLYRAPAAASPSSWSAPAERRAA